MRPFIGFVSVPQSGGLSICSDTVFASLMNDANTSAPANGSINANIYEGALCTPLATPLHAECTAEATAAQQKSLGSLLKVVLDNRIVLGYLLFGQGGVYPDQRLWYCRNSIIRY